MGDWKPWRGCEKSPPTIGGNAEGNLQLSSDLDVSGILKGVLGYVRELVGET
jgi:hypothetical protein